MKKTFLLRLFSLAFFCSMSLVIKSETSSCNIQCSNADSKAAFMQSSLFNDIHESPVNHDDGFFIKI